MSALKQARGPHFACEGESALNPCFLVHGPKLSAMREPTFSAVHGPKFFAVFGPKFSVFCVSCMLEKRKSLLFCCLWSTSFTHCGKLGPTDCRKLANGLVALQRCRTVLFIHNDGFQV